MGRVELSVVVCGLSTVDAGYNSATSAPMNGWALRGIGTSRDYPGDASGEDVCGVWGVHSISWLSSFDNLLRHQGTFMLQVHVVYPGSPVPAQYMFLIEE